MKPAVNKCYQFYCCLVCFQQRARHLCISCNIGKFCFSPLSSYRLPIYLQGAVVPPLCGLLLLVLPLVNPLSAKNEVLKHKRAEVKLSIKNNQVSTAATVFAFHLVPLLFFFCVPLSLLSLFWPTSQLVSIWLIHTLRSMKWACIGVRLHWLLSVGKYLYKQTQAQYRKCMIMAAQGESVLMYSRIGTFFFMPERV